MFEQFRVPYLNTTTMSIEEISTKIVEVAGLKRFSKPLISQA
jgi:regulator of PEP synthase PpsR (kinase-PPPase family)